MTNWLDFTKTIIPLALMASESKAHEAGYIDSEPIRVRGIIVNYAQESRIMGVECVMLLAKVPFHIKMAAYSLVH